MKRRIWTVLCIAIMVMSMLTASASAEEHSGTGMEVETYTCPDFTVTIPKGWSVEYETYDAGDGIMRIIACIRDPEHSDNRIFYATAMEPFFVSVDAKNALLPYLPEPFEWSPILEDDPTAEAVLRLWPNCYTMMQAQGMGHESYVGNYRLEKVVDINQAEDAGNAVTGVHAKVSIGGGDQLYDMFFEDQLVLTNPPANAPQKAKYYVSYNNLGIVVSEDEYEAWIDTLIQCAASFDFSDSQFVHD